MGPRKSAGRGRVSRTQTAHGGCGPQAHTPFSPFPREGGKGMGLSGLEIVC